MKALFILIVLGFLWFSGWESASTSSQIRILTSGDLFVYSDHGNDVWVYGVNSWGQKLLSGFTPINLSLSGTTLYYDGMDAQGNYIVGKIDVLTKANTTLNVGVVDELIGFN